MGCVWKSGGKVEKLIRDGGFFSNPVGGSEVVLENHIVLNVRYFIRDYSTFFPEKLK
jgi:hypothetical protein